MNEIRYILCCILGLSVLISCKTESKSKDNASSIPVDSLLQIRYQKLLEYPVDSTAFPRSYTASLKIIKKVPSKDWTSGFFPGNLWHLYQLTGKEIFKEKAAQWTSFIEKEKFNNGTHDMGFKVFCSFGEGLKITDSQEYKNIIMKSAQTLSTRFNQNVGCIRSWDFNKDIWEFPVIIDNMMNLELLFEATRISGDSTFHKIAVQHANTTLRHHYRTDNSSFHVVVYDTITGRVKDKVTHQGFNAESAWARGQAWGIYGYTLSYRYTKDPAYLAQAQASADFFINHPKLPEDGIPFWDFNDPALPNAPRDVSAGAIVASALLELSRYVEKPEYIDYSSKVLASLKSKEYLLSSTVEAPFLLDHSTGNWPKKDEMDEPIVYGDYYFLEALLRARNL